MKELITDIFSETLHKLTLRNVRLVSSQKTDTGRGYYIFDGEFAFYPVEYIFDDEQYLELSNNKEKSLRIMHGFNSESSNEFRHRYTKKVIIDNEIKKIDFDYVFDVIPKNIVDFSFNAKHKTMTLIVRGSGI